MVDLASLTVAIESGDRTTATAVTAEAIAEGLEPRAILGAMTAAMEVVGGRFQCNEVFVPEMLISARAMKESMALLEPILVRAGIRPEHTAVIGTIKGDLHDIGKNLVAMMWRGANIRVIDLGTNVAPEQFVAAATEHAADIVGISALLTTTMVGMKDVVAAIRAADLAGVKVVIGGAPVTQDYADGIGADAYAPDAGSAVEMARRLLTWCYFSVAPPASVAERVPRVRAAAESAGRPMPPVSGRVTLRFDAPPPAAGQPYAMTGAPEVVAAEVRAYAGAGVDHLALVLRETEPARYVAIAERFAREVMPLVG